MPAGASELELIGLLFGLFVLPRFLQRFRVPMAVTSFLLGALAGPVLGRFVEDPAVQLLSTFGIVALFLCAGLDVDPGELRARAGVLLEHLVVQIAAFAGLAWLVVLATGLERPPAFLMALALLTPSCGFILDSLGSLAVSREEVSWIRAKAISTEIVALGGMFVILQSGDAVLLGVSTAALAAMIFLLPLVFRAFARWIVPHAPRTEFAFLIILAVVCALATRKLGVYYLVGAFVVGMAAKSLRERLPAMASERMVHAVEAFASLFIPFYFFHAALHLRPEDIGPAAWLWGLGFLAAALPLRILLVALHRRLRLREAFPASLRVAVPLVPTLVFTLVLAEILKERFGLPGPLFGGLVVYALASTLLPGFLLHSLPATFDELAEVASNGADPEARLGSRALEPLRPGQRSAASSTDLPAAPDRP